MNSPSSRFTSPGFEHIAVLRDSGKYDDAIQQVQKMLAETTDPDERGGLLIDGLISSFHLGRLAEARHMLGELKKLDIQDEEGRLNAEFCEPLLLIQEHEFAQAVDKLEQMLQSHAEELRNPRFRYLYEDIQRERAMALVQLGRYSEALPVLRESANFSFGTATEEQELEFWLAFCLAESHDIGGARHHFLCAVNLNLKNELEAEARYRLARIYYDQEGFAQARKQLEMIVESYPKGIVTFTLADIYETLSYTYRQLGDHEKARDYLNLAKQYHSSTAPIDQRG